MRYEVNGVFFNNQYEAEEYEKKLHDEYEAEKKKVKMMRYKQALAEKLRVFRASSNDKILYFAVILNGDHHEYAYALAEDALGKRYTFDKNGLRVNWVLEEESRLVEQVLDIIVSGKASEMKDLKVYQGVSIEVSDSYASKACDMCPFDMVCPKIRCVFPR